MNFKHIKCLAITHDTGNLGAPNSLLLLLKEFVKEGWSISVIARIDNGELSQQFEQLGSFNVFHNKKSLKDSNVLPPGLNLVRKEFEDWNPHFIYSNTAMNGDIISALKPKCPVVTHVRELKWFLDLLEGKRLHSFLEDTDLYFCASQSVKNYLSNKYNIKASVLEVAHASIDENYIQKQIFLAEGISIRQILGIPDDYFVIGTVGRIDQRKGIDLFEKFVVNLKNSWSFNKKALIWVGGGPLEEELILKYNESSDPIIRFVGKQLNPFIYFLAMNCYISFSRDDPFPRASLEAGIIGLPVMAFKGSGGADELLNHEPDMLIENFDVNKMISIINVLQRDINDCQMLGLRLQKKIKKFYTIRTVAQHVILNLKERVLTK